MPSLHYFISVLAGIIGIALLLRLEALLVRDVGKREAAPFAPERILEYKLVGSSFFLDQILRPMATAATVTLVNFAGGGLIHLANNGVWYFPSLLAFLVLFDLYSYLVHRAYHKVPALWALHSFHHSAPSLSAATGALHHWLLGLVSAILFAPLFGALVSVPPDVLLPVLAVNQAIGALTHFDVDLDFGRLALWINGPRWHRVHHSDSPKLYNKNFANIFPFFDVIFGTAWVPVPGEIPALGLPGDDRPESIVEGLIWPLRGPWRRRRVALRSSAGLNAG